MNNLDILAPRLLLAFDDRSCEKAQVYLLSIELFRSSDRRKMTARWDAKMFKLFIYCSLVSFDSIFKRETLCHDILIPKQM